VIGFLRFVGLINAAVWFGSSVLFTFAIGPAVFSQDMRQLLGEAHYPFFSGAIAQVLIHRFLDLQVICALIAVFHAFGEWLYLGRPLHRLWLGLLAGLVAASLLGNFVFQPRIKAWHQIKYAQNRSPGEKDAAARSLRIWHGASQGVNLLALVGLLIYLWRLANPINATRFVPSTKFQG
jgi:hypothetical protein